MGSARSVWLPNWWSGNISEIEVSAQQLLMDRVHGGSYADEASSTYEIKTRDI